MTQNNLYMEDENLRLYIDVQPLYIDALENSKNEAQASASQAMQSKNSASAILTNIISLKNSFDSLYNQALANITSLKNEAISDLNSLKSSITGNLQSAYNTILNSFDYHYNQLKSYLETLVNQAKEYADEAKDAIDNRVSADYLNQSKAMETGSVSNNSSIFSWVKSMSHSTFDRSKFTIAGSPVITNDGIASGFSTSNKIYTTLSQSITLDKVDVWGSFTTPAALPSALNIINHFGTSGNIAEVLLQINYSDGKFSIGYHNNTTWTGSYSEVLNLSTKYYYHVYFDDDANKIKADLSTDGVNYTNKINQSITVSETISTDTVYIGSLINGSSPFEGTIDLKYANISADGVPDFCGNKTGTDTYTINSETVNIPYTESKTGSKIVDSYYRTQVTALYNQFGYAPYYTLDEVNGNFTLPMGEIYGMIENLRTLISQIQAE